ncbi:hypothetical protein QLX08_004564 [Tetragonisca angustula]|uniref:Bystin n=1 Tax=Tetragonisca angustula TaxID=166442 RepID=A0AAW1A4Q7_9HYME
MGKAKKIKVSKSEMKQPKMALGDQIEEGKIAKSKNRQKNRIRKEDDDKFVDPILTKRILSQARQQQMEIEEENAIGRTSVKKPVVSLSTSVEFSDTEEPSSEDEHDNVQYYENIEINEEDERAIQMFMSKDPVPMKTLADIILEKLTEKKTEIETQFSDVGSIQMQELDPRVKAILRNWEQILYVTEPTKWSAAAMYQATRIFASNLKEKMAQRFYNLILLPRIRDDLAEYKRLNFHLYQALRKALFKPAGFMKGILLPLLESGTSILKIAEMDYTGANSIFLRIFLDKKYALPYRVIDAVVFHFLRFERDSRELPVLWHQALLTFVQRYKSDISSEQKEALLRLLKKQFHHTITADVRRELQHAKCRDTEITEPALEPMIY